MSVNEIIIELADIIEKELNIAVPEDVNRQTLLSELGIDSIAMMALWVYAEEKFSYETDEDALVGDQVNSIGDIAEYIHKKITS
jgi:acyl carrier protein